MVSFLLECVLKAWPV